MPLHKIIEHLRMSPNATDITRKYPGRDIMNSAETKVLCIVGCPCPMKLNKPHAKRPFAKSKVLLGLVQTDSTAGV